MFSHKRAHIQYIMHAHVTWKVLYDRIAIIEIKNDVFEYQDSVPCLFVCLRFTDPLKYQTIA